MNDVNDEVGQLNAGIRRLKTAYDQYFAGIERIEPLKEREALKKDLRRLLSVRNNNTAFKFRLQSAQQTLLTYETYWDRIARQIEEGTFKRDKVRAQKLASAAPEQEAGAPAPREEPAAPAAAEARAPAPAGAARYPESIRKLHETYLRARAQTGDTRPLSLDMLAETVKKQITTIKQQYGCERVEFKVTIKDGKAVLKAIPK